MLRNYIHICFFLCWGVIASAQNQNHIPILQEKDTIKEKKNREIYKNIEEYSNRSKFIKLLHDLLLHSTKSENKYSPGQKIENELNRNFNKFQGKIIRKIHIRVLDPFGFDEKDSTIIPTKNIDKIGNALHGRTKSFTIKGLVLLKENEALDSVKVLESERLLRDRRYVRRVLIRPKTIHKSDSVDVYISVLDNWSLDVDGDISNSWGRLRLREHNIFGLGHRLTGVYKQEFINKKRTAYAIGYNAENIYNTFINANIYRDTDFNGTYQEGIKIDRPFYSQYNRWAGSVGTTKQYYLQDIYQEDNNKTIHNPIKTQTFEAWGGVSFPILHKLNTSDKITNLIIALRFNHVKYLQRPDFSVDPVSFFSDENVVLGSVTLRNISYTRDRYIFRNGDIEDIAIGKTFFVVSGLQDNQGSQNPYLGLGYIFSKYFHFGYFSSNIQWGSYIIDKNISQSVFKLESTYFTPPFRLGDWYFRQFIKGNLVIGSNRKDFVKDRITLNGDDGIQGFDTDKVYGTRKIVLNFQTQSYVPFNWFGFRMSPFLTADFGFIGQDTQPFLKNDMYTKFGIGFLISNDYFVFSNIQFSFFYLPKIPGQGTNIYKFSGAQNDDFGLQNYEYSPPHIIQYR